MVVFLIADKLFYSQYISAYYGRGRSHSDVVETFARIGAGNTDVDENYVLREGRLAATFRYEFKL